MENMIFPEGSSSLGMIEQLYKFVLNSSPGELSASKLANSLGKDFESISTYLRYLEQAGLIRFLYPASSGQAALRNPIKMYPENTNLMHAAYLPLAQDQIRGKIRETFFVNQLHNVKQPLFYSKVGDFKLEERIFEIGGRNKNQRQIKYEKSAYTQSDSKVGIWQSRRPEFEPGEAAPVQTQGRCRLVSKSGMAAQPKPTFESRGVYILSDDIIVGSKNVIPLYLFGFLY